MRNMLKKFWKEEKATVALEAVLLTPILAWVFIASFVFFDAFRTYNTSIKATYAVADVLSRRTAEIASSDIEGLSDVFQFLTRDTEGTAIRITQITRQTSGYRVDWSHGTDGMTYVRESDFDDFVDQIPIMAFGDRLLLVETVLPYSPAFSVGLTEQDFYSFTVTRPRFAGQVAFDADMGNSYVYDNGNDVFGTDGIYYVVEDDGVDDDPAWDGGST